MDDLSQSLAIQRPDVRAAVMALIARELGAADADMLDISDDEPLVDIARYNPHAGTHPLRKMPIDIARNLPIGAGFAYPVVRATRRIIEEPFAYLLSLADKGNRAESGRWAATTNRNYAYLLRPVCEALLQDGRPFRYLDHDSVDLVVSAMLTGVNRRGQPLSGETIEATVRAAVRCAEHLNKIGLTSIVLDGDLLLARCYGVSTVYGKDGKRLDRDRLLGARRHMMRPLTRSAIDRLEAELKVRPRDWEEGWPSSRPRLTMDNGRRNGLRVIENLGLHFEDVMRPTIVDRDREYGFIVKLTKGSDHREVVARGHEIVAWQDYAMRERKACVKAARTVHGNNWDEPIELLVNGMGSGAHVGEATQPSTIQRDFREPQIRLGMFEGLEIAMPDGSTRIVRVVDHCYHDLRHTYAHAMYKVAIGLGGEEDPIAFVQIRLGHAHRSTTSRIYLWPDRRKVAMVGDMACAGVRARIDG